MSRENRHNLEYLSSRADMHPAVWLPAPTPTPTPDRAIGHRDMHELLCIPTKGTGSSTRRWKLLKRLQLYQAVERGEDGSHQGCSRFM